MLKIKCIKMKKKCSYAVHMQEAGILCEESHQYGFLLVNGFAECAFHKLFVFDLESVKRFCFAPSPKMKSQKLLLPK